MNCRALFEPGSILWFQHTVGCTPNDFSLNIIITLKHGWLFVVHVTEVGVA